MRVGERARPARPFLRWAWVLVGVIWSVYFLALAEGIASVADQDASERDSGTLAARAAAAVALVAGIAAANPAARSSCSRASRSSRSRSFAAC